MKILYWISENTHRKVVLPMKEQSEVEQAVVVHTKVSTDNFRLKKIYKYNNIDELKNLINMLEPDILFQCTASRDLTKFRGKIKHGFIAHGVWPKSVTNIECASKSFYQGFDLICGASRLIGEIFSGTDVTVATDVLTQFDVLYDAQKSFKRNREKLINGADRLITFFGHNITQKTDKLRPYDRGFFEAADKISKIAAKNNWMVYLKAKCDNISKLPNNSNFVIVHHSEDPYPYFCSDIIITSARSTVEVEAALLEKPIIRIFMPSTKLTGAQKSYEYLAMDFGAEHLVTSLDDLERKIISSFDSDELIDKQKKFIEYLGITFDGKANERLLDAAKKLLGE